MAAITILFFWPEKGMEKDTAFVNGNWPGWLLLAMSLFSMASGCARQPPPMAEADLQRMVSEQALVERTLAAPPFYLLTLSPATTTGSVLRVYIEGDGRAWLSRSWLSSDPTPATSLVLELLVADRSPDKAYLARPCQFIQTAACDSIYWSSHRFSPEVLDSLNEALNQLKDAGKYQSLELVGHSGGGTVAALLAARRYDVTSLRTVGGNLDHVWLNKHHRVSPLNGSLNPPDFADRLASIPQRHFMGADDQIVPPEIYQSYAGFFPDARCLSVTIVPGADHIRGWRENWPRLLEQTPCCSGRNQ
jgi:hypothetical protein